MGDPILRRFVPFLDSSRGDDASQLTKPHGV